MSLLRQWSALLLPLCLTTLCWAVDDRQDFVANVNEENDFFVLPRTDKHYTQGLHFSLMWPDDEPPWPTRLLAWTPPLGFDSSIRKFGIEFGQNIYTPTNMNTTAVVTNDRPYAGWLFVGLIREDRGVTAQNIPTLDRYEVQLGVIGHWALAEQVQNWWHQTIGTVVSKGWNNQLDNEPGILLRFDRKWRIMNLDDAGGLSLQLLPRAGVALGNVETSARCGTMLRVGYHIPDEFGPSIPPTWGWYLFSDLGGRAVLHNAFLDGNLYQDSHSVAKEPVVLELRAGVALELGCTEISYTYVYLNKEFKLQDKYDAYASLNLTYRF